MTDEESARLATVLFLLVLAAAHPARLSPAQAMADFPGPPLSTKYARLPRPLRKTPNCYIADYIDCEFAARGGMNYLVYGDELTRKQIRRGRGPMRWPYGLTAHDDRRAVMAKLSRRYRLVFHPSRDNGNEVLWAALPGDCYLAFKFGGSGGHLREATLGCPTETD